CFHLAFKVDSPSYDTRNNDNDGVSGDIPGSWPANLIAALSVGSGGIGFTRLATAQNSAQHVAIRMANARPRGGIADKRQHCRRARVHESGAHLARPGNTCAGNGTDSRDLPDFLSTDRASAGHAPTAYSRRAAYSVGLRRMGADSPVIRGAGSKQPGRQYCGGDGNTGVCHAGHAGKYFGRPVVAAGPFRSYRRLDRTRRHQRPSRAGAMASYRCTHALWGNGADSEQSPDEI